MDGDSSRAIGQLDPAFGEGGRLLTDLQPTGDRGGPLALLPDGRLVVVGSGPRLDDVRLLCLRADGRPDATFGEHGTLALPLTEAHALDLAPDGALLVAGQIFVDERDGYAMAVARVLPTGLRDEAFGEGGVAVVPFGRGCGSSALVVTVAADGAIVLAGSAMRTPDEGVWHVALARLLPDGRPDPAFGEAGRLLLPVERGAAAATLVRALPNGGVIVLGDWTVAVPVEERRRDAENAGPIGRLARRLLPAPLMFPPVIHLPPADDVSVLVLSLTPDGAGDGLREGRRLVLPLRPVRYGHPGCLPLVLGAGGLLLAAGAVENVRGGHDLAVARFDGEGRMDHRFGLGGWMVVGPPHPRSDRDRLHALLRGEAGPAVAVHALALDGAGRVLVGGSLWRGRESTPAIVRLQADGALDRSFGADGWAVLDTGVPSGAGESCVRTLAAQPDGTIIAICEIWPGPNPQLMVMRLHG